jgi:hypothetical protein
MDYGIPEAWNKKKLGMLYQPIALQDEPHSCFCVTRKALEHMHSANKYGEYAWLTSGALMSYFGCLWLFSENDAWDGVFSITIYIHWGIVIVRGILGGFMTWATLSLDRQENAIHNATFDPDEEGLAALPPASEEERAQHTDPEEV